jgi:AAA-like domain
MNIDTCFEHLNRELRAHQNRSLNPAEMLVLRGIWQYQTYSQIAAEVGYSAGYLTNVVAPELLHRLSDLLGQRLTKKNCRILLEPYVASLENDIAAQASLNLQGQLQPSVQRLAQPSATTAINPDQSATPAFPDGAIAIDSPYYILRPPIEAQVCAEICQPGTLVRIKAPREMGKTSLILRMLDHAQQQGYRTVYLNLEQMDQAVCSDLNRFLRSLCASVTHQLQLEPKLDDYWDADIGSKVSCTLYFRQHLLEQIKAPLILVLDELNQIFEYPHVAKDVLPLLRSWYEEAKRVPVWQNLRLVIAHSTEVYVPLQLNQSPFNVGLATQLGGFTLDQVQQLAKRYGLHWNDGTSAEQLMAMVGGHPALIHTALYHLSRAEQTLSHLLATAPTPTGIYHHHLQRHWAVLQQQPALFQAFHTVLSTREPVHLESRLAYQLNSMGLINQLGSEVIVYCELYRQYFQLAEV